MTEKKLIEFRKASSLAGVPTTYITHTIYYYPARFIPHVVRYVIEKYTKPGDLVFDPFAGSGTTGVEAAITGRKSILWDLIPLLNWHIKAKLTCCSEDDFFFLAELVKKSVKFRRKFKPKWKNVTYWYPKKVLTVVERSWGFFHEVAESEITKYDEERLQGLKAVLAFSLLYASRRLSYTDDQIPKLFRSRMKRKKLDKLLREKKPRELFVELALRKLRKIVDSCKQICQYSENIKDNMPIVYAPVDVLEPREWGAEWPRGVKAVITSPPYLAAQEYVRSVKLELYWLKGDGYFEYNDEFIKRLSSLEIPYRKVEPVSICSETYEKFIEEIPEKRRKIVENYFFAMTKSLNNITRSLSEDGLIAIFVGSATVCGKPAPIAEIFKEHLESLGLVENSILEDTVKVRKFFNRARKNANPNGITSEVLLVMRKK